MQSPTRPALTDRSSRLRLALLLLVTGACSAQMQMPPPEVGSISLAPRVLDDTPIYQSAGTRKMADRLKQVFENTDFRLDPNKAAHRVTYYTDLLKTQRLPLRQDTEVREQLAREMLYAGDSEGAVRQLLEVRRRWAVSKEPMPADGVKEVGRWLATAYLRIGEQENCAHMHGQRACIFPLSKESVHQMPRGAQGAVKELTALLEADASDSESQWLLNVAYMQLGRYPRDVPAPWLIPEKQFRSDTSLPAFAEVAASAGIDITSHAGGVAVEDFDGDGRLDVMVTSSGPNDQMHLFHNNGDGTFRDVTRASGLMGETGGLNLVLTDYNNDGHKDVLVLRGGWWGRQGCYPVSLLRNNGNGTFDDVTEEAGLLFEGPTQTAAWADFDRDGWLDLFIGYESGSTQKESHPSRLYHNNRNGTFTEMSTASGLTNLGFVKGVAWGDYNKDGWPDLYVSVMYGKNHLFRNDGNPKGAGWSFTDVTSAAGVDKQENSFACWFFDYDNDGWPDLFVAGYAVQTKDDVGKFEMGASDQAGRPKLYRNLHDGTFKDMTSTAHLDRAILPMGANFGDLDNDGWLDVYLGTGDSTYQALLPNRMFRNASGRAFDDVTTAGGFGHLQKGHGIAFADLRGNGLEDIFEEMGGAQPGDIYQSALYRNPGNENHSVTLDLEGVTSNRAAFGAEIEVKLRTSAKELRHLYRTVGYGSSFGGNPLRQHIGLGPATSIEELVVRWPGSARPYIGRHIAVDKTYRLREGGQLQPQAAR